MSLKEKMMNEMMDKMIGQMMGKDVGKDSEMPWYMCKKMMTNISKTYACCT